MKKILAVMGGVFLAFGVSGNAGAISFTDTEVLNEWLTGSGIAKWWHNTPTDFGVPPDNVNSASLCILAWAVNDANDQIEIEGQVQGTLDEGRWSWFPLSWTSLNIKNVFATVWEEGSMLEVRLNYDETATCGWNSLKLISSTFKLDYDNNPHPIPEPGTMLLLGLGLTGLAGFKMKKILGSITQIS